MKKLKSRVSMKCRRVNLFLIFGMSILLSGCGSRELEERKFPLVLAVDKSTTETGGEENTEGKSKKGFQITTGYQDLSQVADQNAKSGGSAPTKTEEMSWYEAFEENDAGNPKTIDYNHLKAVILSQEVLNDKTMLEEFLDFVKEQEVFARNTLLFTSDKKAEEILKLEGKLELPVGTWLEELTADDREVDNSAIVTLGSLLNEYENRMENIYIPVLSAKEDTMKMEQYYVMSAYENMGVVEKDTFRRAMLLEGKMKQFDLELENGEAVRLKEIRSEKSYEADKEELVLAIRIEAEADVLNRRVATTKEQKELATQIQEELQKLLQYDADRLLLEKQTDMGNGFYSLGGYDRQLYEKYGEDIVKYKQNLRLEIETKITPVAD